MNYTRREYLYAATCAVTKAHSSASATAGVLIEHLLHLAWLHVMATMNDQIHLAFDDVLVAVLVHPADVARAEQAIGVDGVGRRI